MKQTVTTVHVGATQPFSLLHMTDTHINLADGRDDERKQAAAAQSWGGKPHGLAELAFVTEQARLRDLPVVHTGDLTEIVTEANLDWARAFAGSVELRMVAGNHDFSQYREVMAETSAYRLQSIDKLRAVYKNDVEFDARVVNGVNLVLLCNCYYQIDRWQLERLREEVCKGYPVVLFLHMPLYTEELYDFMRACHAAAGTPNRAVFLMSVPEEKMDYYTPLLLRQQRQDADTAEAYRYILAEPRIRAVIAGHTHQNFEGTLGDGRVQITTDVNTLRELRFE